MNAAEFDTDGDLDGKSQTDAIDQYLTFIMADEEYGVDILTVKEIRIWDSATPIPKAPDHVRGVINLRGTIVPIIDLRQCFGMPAIEYGPETVVLVLQVETETGHREVGIVVDAVSDVYSLDPAQVKPSPDMGSKVNTAYIRGLAKIEEKMVILLDMGKLLNQEDFSGLAEVQQAMRDSGNLAE
jgi:purine-binding chemotaxis protein CheW